MFELITDYILSTLQVFKDHSGPLYFFVFMTALLESLPIIGVFLPGTLLLLLFGLFCAKGYVSIWAVVLLATIGATLGDIGGYLLGKYGRRFFKENNRFLKLAHLKTGQAFFEKHGGKSILFGRFIGPIRPIIALVAGATHYIPKRFLKWNISGAFLWSGTYIVVGFVFAKNIKLIDDIISQIGGVAFVLLVAGTLTYIYFKKRKKMIQD
jgi:undecaprenyl-diphosphatase